MAAVDDPIERAADLLHKRGMVILLSDILADPAELEKPLLRLAAIGHEICAFQILDPSERDFQFQQSSLFEDAESGATLHIDPATARAGYLERFNAHQQSLAALCARVGVSWHPIATDRPLGLALFDFLQDRARRGRIIRRAS
jgi:uncharacterized protein (DUF58 family)